MTGSLPHEVGDQVLVYLFDHEKWVVGEIWCMAGSRPDVIVRAGFTMGNYKYVEDAHVMVAPPSRVLAQAARGTENVIPC